MFNPDFYPTPSDVIYLMLEDVNITNKVILEPSAGKGDIMDYLNNNGAQEVLFCEIEEDLQAISKHKGRFLAADFLSLNSSEISHIDMIVMNPPFSQDVKHILHAFSIAPAGCKIISLCNAESIGNDYTYSRRELKNLIDLYGMSQSLGDCFSNAERKTNVEVGLVVLEKAGADYSTEFEGFYLDEEEEPQGSGIMSYNVVRDLVNRYVESLKIFDKQLEEGVRMSQLTTGYFDVKIGLQLTDKDKPVKRAEFKKAMQKSGWDFIFKKLNLEKFSTKGLKEDLNKFVEQQTHIPFTMRNIYKMLELVIGTNSQRMDKALMEVFDKVTQHYHENRFSVEGWKTNSHYLLTQKFIIPYMTQVDKWHSGERIKRNYGNNFELIEDLVKALCFLTGDNYDRMISLSNFLTYAYKVKTNGEYGNYDSFFSHESIEKAEKYCKELTDNGRNAEIENSDVKYGEWHNWGYFRIKCFKKGTVHFEFIDKELWGKFNQRIAQIKGYPLYEKAPDKRTEKQKTKSSNEPRPTHQMKQKHRFEAQEAEN